MLLLKCIVDGENRTGSSCCRAGHLTELKIRHLDCVSPILRQLLNYDVPYLSERFVESGVVTTFYWEKADLYLSVITHDGISENLR